jgi:hypothetical protein
MMRRSGLQFPQRSFPKAAVLRLVAFFLLVVSLPAALPLNELSVQRYMKDVAFLASPDMNGRGNGTPELERAADFIATQFREAGLRPAGEGNSFFQAFEVTTGTEFGPGNRLEMDGIDARYNQDFVTVPFSARGSFDGGVVFAGYGITAPDLEWDDYAGIDVKGKAVVVFRHQPEEANPKSKFAGTAHATFINKAINARNHGARAIIFITDPTHANEPDDITKATLALEATEQGVIAMHASRESVMPLFKRAGRDMTDVQRSMDASLRPESFEFTGSRVILNADVNRIRRTVRNVLAAVPGADPQLSNEWIVIGAHYDHLGIGGRSSLSQADTGKPHLGADDNASGTSGLLELARLVSRHRQDFKRSVLFIAFSGEELGLFGSNHFVNNPTVPANSITGMINMDMIGRQRNNRLDVMGTGTSPDFRSWVEEANKPVGLTLNLSDGGHEGSDHISFSSKRIPVLFFFSGLHEDYHRPSDTADKINGEGAIKILSVVAGVAEQMANVAARPQYTEVRRPDPPAGGAAGGGGGYGPWFGSVPDFRDDLNGVLFADVRSDSPAGKAGLRAGDLLIEFAGQPIRNLQEFTYALGSRKPGDVVQVAVRRDGKVIRVDVTLEVRR